MVQYLHFRILNFPLIYIYMLMFFLGMKPFTSNMLQSPSITFNQRLYKLKRSKMISICLKFCSKSSASLGNTKPDHKIDSGTPIFWGPSSKLFNGFHILFQLMLVDAMFNRGRGTALTNPVHCHFETPMNLEFCSLTYFHLAGMIIRIQ